MLRRTWDHDCGDLLEGGVAEGSEVMPGSTISRVTLFRQATKGNVLSDALEKVLQIILGGTLPLPLLRVFRQWQSTMRL